MFFNLKKYMYRLKGGMGREMGGGTWVYLWLILVDVWQKTRKFCKAIILQLKTIFFKKRICTPLYPIVPFFPLHSLFFFCLENNSNIVKLTNSTGFGVLMTQIQMQLKFGKWFTILKPQSPYLCNRMPVFQSCENSVRSCITSREQSSY